MQYIILFFTLISILYSEPIDSKKIMQSLELSSQGKTEVVKNFPKGFPEILTKRGKPIIYTKENSENFEYIGMPIGGIGAGQLYLGGDGKLWFWDILGLNYKIKQLKGEEAYEFPYKRSKPTEKGQLNPEQGFSISVKKKKQWITKNLDRDGIKDISFLGEYPIGTVTYRDPELPVRVQLEAFSPFIPLDVENSIYPATILNFTVENTSDKPAQVRLNGWLENIILEKSRENKELALRGVRQYSIRNLREGGLRIEHTVELDNASQKKMGGVTDYGSLSLSLLGQGVTAFKEKGAVSLEKEESLVGKLTKEFTLAPGETKTGTFILTWHFPTTRALFITPWYRKDGKSVEKINQNYYATKYKDAMSVSDHLIKHLDALSKTTRDWRDTWYDSTLPYWFLDRTFLNTSILASSTCNLIDDRLFYGTEGGNQGVGTVNHVWGYVKAMGRLFPELEKSLREQVDFIPTKDGGALTPEGVIRYRWNDSKEAKSLAVDGQCGIILRAYLSHQMSKNNRFLKGIYPNMKKAMLGLTELRDSDHDGILTGAQHNTLDGIWYGKVTWLSLHYTVALRAMAEMADDMGDYSYAKFCRETADKGRLYIEENLFNGEYFIHEADPEVPESPGTYTGLEYSQLFGQSWAYHVGLGEIIDPKKARKALESMWRYNFTTDVGPFRKKFKPGRWYAMPGESGMIACTWPRGGSEVLSKGRERYAAYNNECQNGYEYAATSLMMWHDMPYHSLAHVWLMHNDRYHGSKRNPWCEIEWGIHYSRSMASYGHFTAAGGFEHHGPKRHIGFAPQISANHFKSAFTSAEGWGTFEQKKKGEKQSAQLTMKWGKLVVKTLSLKVEDGKKATSLHGVTIDGQELKGARLSQKGQRILIEFPKPISLKKAQTMRVEFQ